MNVTKERVRTAIHGLRNEGITEDEDLTSDLLRGVLKSGSKTTILKYRDEIFREEKAPKSEIPPQLKQAIEVAWAGEQRKCIDNAFAMSEARVSVAEKRAESAVSELASETARADRYEETARQEHKANSVLKSELKKLSHQLEKRSAELERLKGQMELIRSQQKEASRRKGGDN